MAVVFPLQRSTIALYCYYRLQEIKKVMLGWPPLA